MVLFSFLVFTVEWKTGVRVGGPSGREGSFQCSGYSPETVVVLGIESRSSPTLGKHSNTEPHPHLLFRGTLKRPGRVFKFHLSETNNSLQGTGIFLRIVCCSKGKIEV